MLGILILFRSLFILSTNFHFLRKSERILVILVESFQRFFIWSKMISIKNFPQSWKSVWNVWRKLWFVYNLSIRFRCFKSFSKVINWGNNKILRHINFTLQTISLDFVTKDLVSLMISRLCKRIKNSIHQICQC